MVLLILVLFALVAISLILWSGIGTQKLITRLYKEGRLVELPPPPELDPASRAMEEVTGLYSGKKMKNGVEIGEKAFCSVLLFQVGKPPADATLDATVFGLRALESLDGRDSAEVQEVLYNAKKSMPDFLQRHLDPDLGGARHHVGAYPMIYGCYYFFDGMRWFYGRKVFSWLAYQHLVDFVGAARAKKFVNFIRTCQVDVPNKAKAFAEVPGGEIGTITTGGASRILSALGVEGFNVMELDEVEMLKKVARFIDMCRVELPQNAERPYGFANRIGKSNVPQTNSTHHALKTYAIIQKVMQAKRWEWSDKPSLDASCIARFLKACQMDSGFSRAPSEPASVFYTEQVLGCRNYYPFEGNSEEIKRIVKYEPVLSFLESCLVNDGFGFEKESYPNIYAARSAAFILSNIRELYRNESERDQSREKEISAKIRRALLSHFDIKTGLAVGYRTI